MRIGLDLHASCMHNARMPYVNVRISRATHSLLKKLSKHNGHTLHEQVYRLAQAAWVPSGPVVMTSPMRERVKKAMKLTAFADAPLKSAPVGGICLNCAHQLHQHKPIKGSTRLACQQAGCTCRMEAGR